MSSSTEKSTMNARISSIKPRPSSLENLSRLLRSGLIRKIPPQSVCRFSKPPLRCSRSRAKLCSLALLKARTFQIPLQLSQIRNRNKPNPLHRRISNLFRFHNGDNLASEKQTSAAIAVSLEASKLMMKMMKSRDQRGSTRCLKTLESIATAKFQSKGSKLT